MNCPSAPILNNPVLNAKATDNPVQINGIVDTKISAILLGSVKIFPITPNTSPGAAPIAEIRIAPIINEANIGSTALVKTFFNIGSPLYFLTPAISRPSCSFVTFSSLSTTSIILPLWITAILSDKVRISSKSNEISRTLLPLSR